MTSPYLAADDLVRVYPAKAPNGSGLVWAHGGGFGAGDLDMPEADAVARSLAAAGTTVISVDYRLVGDGCRYPAPSDDILTAWIWTLAHADDLGIERLAIGGASAGANLVTGATLRMLHEPVPKTSARQGGGIRLPDLVVLAYPTLLAVQPEPDAALRIALDADPLADRFGPEVVRGMYENFLGGPVDDAPLYAVPGLATADGRRRISPDAHDQRRRRRTPGVGPGLRRHAARRGTRDRRRDRGGHPARTPEPPARTGGIRLARSHRPPPRRPGLCHHIPRRVATGRRSSRRTMTAIGASRARRASGRMGT